MSGTAPPFPRVFFKLCSRKSIPLLRIPNSHTLNLLLFCCIYYVTCINFDAIWKGIFHSINLGIKAKRWAMFIWFTLRICLPPHLMLSLSYSEGTSGSLSCKILFWFFSDTLHYTATNRACQLTEHGGLRLLFYQVWNIISKLCFFYTFQLSPSGESVTLKTLVLDSQTGVSCNNWVLMEKKCFHQLCSYLYFG